MISKFSKRACYCYNINTVEYLEADSISELARKALGKYSNGLHAKIYVSMKSEPSNKKSAYGFVWFYKSEGVIAPPQIYLSINHKQATYWKSGQQPDRKKKVIAYRGDEQIHYDSIKEAAEDFQTSHANISRALRRVKKSSNRNHYKYKEDTTAAGWHWRYAD